MSKKIDLENFLREDFEGRIRLVNSVHGTRLWSRQLGEIWVAIIKILLAKHDKEQVLRLGLLEELIALIPDSASAEEAYRELMAASDCAFSSVSPSIVYLIISCNKPANQAAARAHHQNVIQHLQPCFIVLGDVARRTAYFDGQVLTVPAPDNYEGLTWKILEAFLAVRKQFGCVGVLKMDDDTQVIAPPDLERIGDLMKDVQYAGYPVGDVAFDRCWHVGKRQYLGDDPYRRRFRGPWAAGPLYFVGPRALDIIVREYLFYKGEFDAEKFGYEDKAIGELLRAHGIELAAKDLKSVFGIRGPFGGSFGDEASEVSVPLIG